jgi:nicotinamidase-related amidase
VLRSGGIKHLVMAGLSTSGVILSTFTLAADEDYSMTILSDACADPKTSLHEELMTNLFPRSANVLTVDQWIASLPAKAQRKRCRNYTNDKGETKREST